jgi:hypothetical protein
MTPQETADLLNDLILKSVDVLAQAPLNIERKKQGADLANIIWPWSGGYRPAMQTLMEQYPQVKTGAVVSAVDLIQGIGKYAGLDIVKVEGATGLWNTNYEGKTQAALNNLKHKDFVFLHVEASDEAGHDGDIDLKVKTIENLDSRMIGPIYEEVSKWEAENGKLPETVTCITGRGGYHLYFHYEGKDIGNRAGILEGVDVRGEGGYVIAPPSPHPNGTEYVWELPPDEYDFAPLNDIVKRFLLYKEEDPDRKGRDLVCSLNQDGR